MGNLESFRRKKSKFFLPLHWIFAYVGLVTLLTNHFFLSGEKKNETPIFHVTTWQ